MLDERLKNVFVRALGLCDDTDFAQLVYAQHPAWDSVAHMQLVSAIESEFDIMLETDDVLDLSSFDEARTIVRRHHEKDTDRVA